MEQNRPSVELGLVPVRDGNMWSVLYGSNIQEGISGWGKSPEAAMADFDRVWGASIKDNQPVVDEVLVLRFRLRKANSLMVRAMFSLQACAEVVRRAYGLSSTTARLADQLADEIEAYGQATIPVPECSEAP